MEGGGCDIISGGPNPATLLAFQLLVSIFVHFLHSKTVI